MNTQLTKELNKVLIMLSVRLNLSYPQTLGVVITLEDDESKWQMILWLRQMMGKEMDQMLEFREIWLQVEKLKGINM